MGYVWQGACMVEEDVCSKGACMSGGMCGRGTCITGGMCGRGHAWWGAMHGRVHAWQRGCVWQGGGHVWQGMCVAGRACMVGGMHSRGCA